MAYDLKAKAKINLTSRIPVAFYDEIHDSPSLPSSYGAAGWLEGDASFLINDRFDLWKVDPRNPATAQNLTGGEGRRTQNSFRRERLKVDEVAIDPKEPLILSGFDEVKFNDNPWSLMLVSACSVISLINPPNDCKFVLYV